MLVKNSFYDAKNIFSYYTNSFETVKLKPFIP